MQKNPDADLDTAIHLWKKHCPEAAHGFDCEDWETYRRNVMDNADAIEKNYDELFEGKFDRPVQQWPASPQSRSQSPIFSL